MQRKNMTGSQYLCVDGNMPLLQEGITAVICKELPDIRLLAPEEKCKRERVLLILCVTSPQKAAALIQQYRENYSMLKTVLLYDSMQPTDMLHCLSLGCCCVLKSSLSKTELLSCIQVIGSSFFLLDRDLTMQLFEEAEKHHSFIRLLKKEVVVNVPTQREIEIAKCILAGMDNEDIGNKLYLSTGTIKNNIAVILEKYHFHNRAQIISLLAL